VHECTPEHVWSMEGRCEGHWSADGNIIYCPITIVAYFELVPLGLTGHSIDSFNSTIPEDIL